MGLQKFFVLKLVHRQISERKNFKVLKFIML